MNCPNCNTPNDPHNRFCVQCGYTFSGSRATTGSPLAGSASELLSVLTVRLVILLIGLWLLKVILNWLPFTNQLAIPGVSVPLPQMINSLVYIIMFFLLLNYARVLQVLWPESYPKVREASPILGGLVYLLALVVLYYALIPLLGALSAGVDAITVFQAIFFIVAVMLLIYVARVVYQHLPVWLSNLRMQRLFTDSLQETVCLNCGSLNPSPNKYCGNCGKSLSKEQIS